MNTSKLPDPAFLLDQLMHSTLDVIYFKDKQSRFMTYNRACAVKHGWTSLQEGVGKTDFDVFSKEHAENSFADEQRVMSSGEIMQGVEEQEIWPDGHVTWCSSSKVPLRDDSGRIIGIFGITRDITASKEAQMQARRYADQVADIKGMLEEDARMAGKLQHSFFMMDYPVFPEGVAPQESCIEFLHHFNKCNLVSGDYCHVRRLSETRVGILLCDILGTGARAALGAALIRGVMEDISGLAQDPSMYVEHLNKQLYPLLHPEGLLLDVSACYMVLDVSTGEARVVSAGHPLPLHFRKGHPVKWLFENLVFRGPGLAVAPNTKYRAVSCRLQPGDSVVIYTDGLFTVKNARGEPFSEKRLLDTARGMSGKSLGNIFSELENAALAFSRDDAFADDVCLIGVHLRTLLGAV